MTKYGFETRRYLHDNTLWHESGHAVIAHVLGIKVRHVNADRNDSPQVLVDWTGVNRKHAALVFLAGPIVEQRSRKGRADAASLQHVYKTSGSGDISGLAVVGVGRSSALFRLCESETKKLVGAHWQLITRVRLAIEATDAWQITGKQLARIVNSATRTAA